MNRAEIVKQIRLKQSYLCVGLDTDIEKLPPSLPKDYKGALEFNKRIVDATAQYTVAYKPNLAFYECMGSAGLKVFAETVRYIKDKYPQIFVIADAKRGDIGNTAKMYAKTFYETYNVDAVTVAPYMGEDSVSPFLEFEEKWTILLALTSNKGAYDFQYLKDSESSKLLYENVLETSQKWGNEDNLMYVVGATKAEMLADIRKIIPNNFLLVPGVGAQGGSLKEVSDAGLNSDCGLLVNSSRGIIYASSGIDFAEKAAEEASKLQYEMKEYLISKDIINRC
ncbi:MAG: orotidine-5'-phosphate decarboxylase [Bacteroidales bacterium]